MPALAAGTTLKRGTFEIVSYLGRGGFGEVYLARQTRIERDVAIKVLLPHVSENADVVTRFQREALAAATLLHPNVLTVFDFDFDEEARAWFLAMQFVPGGRTLRNLLGSPLSLAEVLPLVEGIAGALDAAHARGIVHRDVKPENVLLDGQRPLLADFGIAHLATMTGMTATGFAVGTPAYMSPEQAAGKPVSPKSDQYALSVIVYEMLAGRPPFVGDPISLIMQHSNAVPPPLASFNPGVGAAARAAILLAMSKNPDDRYESCLELVHELEAARTSAGYFTPGAPSGQIEVARAETSAPSPAPESAGLEAPPSGPEPAQPALEAKSSEGEVQPTVAASRESDVRPTVFRPAPADSPLPTASEEVDADRTAARAVYEPTADAGLTVARSLDEPISAPADDLATASRDLPTDSVPGPTIAREVATAPPALTPAAGEGSDGALVEVDSPPEREAPTDDAPWDPASSPPATVARSLSDGLQTVGAPPPMFAETAEAAGPTVMRALDDAGEPAVWTEPPGKVPDGRDSLPVAPVDGASEAPPAEAEDGAAMAGEVVETVAPPPAVEQPLVSPETGRRPGLFPLAGRKRLAIPAAVCAVAAVVVVILVVRPGSPAVPASDGSGSVALPESSTAEPAVVAEQPSEVTARGTVRVASRPPGGVVSVNGEPAGRAPGSLSLRPGTYDVLVSLPSYRDWTQRVEIAGDEILIVDAELVPLPAVEVLEVSDSRMGRDPYLDPSGLMRIGSFTDMFTIADDVNAIVYLRPKSFSIRELTFTVVSRWQRPGGLPPIEQQGEQRVLSDWDETFVRACAPALTLDSRGSNAPLNLEMAIDGEVVARFVFRVGPGNPANASSSPCNPSAVPARIAGR